MRVPFLLAFDMIAFLTLASVFFLAGSSRSGAIQAGDPGLERRQGLLLRNGEPFTGLVEERADGVLVERRSYRQGRKHGIQEGWWEDGSRRYLYRLKDGEYDGECLEWHSNGRLATLRTWRAGEEEGAEQSWDATGKLVANYVVRGGRRYGTLGARACYTMKDGERDFEATR